MELQSDRQEISVRLLQNGRYVWTITVNCKAAVLKEEQEILANNLKRMDKTLRDAFPNHVRENSVKFQELE